MTIDTSVAARLQGRSLAWRLGASTTAAIGIVLVTWAMSIDVVKATGPGFMGDAATYYTLGRSLASDFDFEFQRADLARVWEQYASGPEGVFLKRHDSRLYFAKAYIYPLCAAPFIWLFGANGFLVFHALLMTACFLCAYSFLCARSHPVGALIFAAAFLFVSLVPAYMVQLGPDFFIFAVVLFGYYFWCYKEVAGPAPETMRPSWRTRWLLAPRSDTVAAALLGVSVFAKPTNVALILPFLVSAALRKQWWRATKMGVVFAGVLAALFAFNIAVTGEWNYQGGERKTFYSVGDGRFQGGFPFQNEAATFDSVGLGSVGGGSFAVLFTRDALLEVFPHNLGYFLVGRHAGFAIYFFPGLMADPAVPGRDARSRDVAVADAGGRRRHGRGVAPVHAVHVVGRWRPGRQSLLPRHLRCVPLSRAAPANRGGGPAGHRRQQPLRGADRDQSVLRRPQPGGTQQGRVVPMAAHRIDDGERFAGERDAVTPPAAAWRRSADARVLHRRQRLRA